MSLSNDIDQIKTNIVDLALGLVELRKEVAELSDKIDGIESSGNEPCPTKADLFQELKLLFFHIAEGRKVEAAAAIRYLTGCTPSVAKDMVEVIHVTDND